MKNRLHQVNKHGLEVIEEESIPSRGKQFVMYAQEIESKITNLTESTSATANILSAAVNSTPDDNDAAISAPTTPRRSSKVDEFDNDDDEKAPSIKLEEALVLMDPDYQITPKARSNSNVRSNSTCSTPTAATPKVSSSKASNRSLYRYTEIPKDLNIMPLKPKSQSKEETIQMLKELKLHQAPPLQTNVSG